MLAKRFPNCICLVINLAFSSLTFQSGSSDPLDVTLYSGSPWSQRSAWFRGYALQNDSDIRDLSVGILYKTIHGKSNLTWDDTGYSGSNTRDLKYKDMPDGNIFYTRSQIIYRIHTEFTFLGVANIEYQRVGVFSFEAKKDREVANTAIVLGSSSATIAMEYRTITVGIGESVTINLSKGGYLNDLRWRHNYGDEIHNLRGSTSAVIDNIRMKDDGVYECYTGTGDILDDNRGIMRLIVRACPSSKWNPPDCEMDCPVCYNGGVCDDKTGVCICPAGFKGDTCKNGCGNNNWGRDCNVVCGTGQNCIGALLCPPDPVGCTCINGFGGNDCKKGYLRFCYHNQVN
ncbi:uncharacterized protein [Antedon mediterranea]|uniref:uncharacterized protein n=1 Tax=Antedon mediterranea TaxID=105859 RepID=UPI003AF50554